MMRKNRCEKKDAVERRGGGGHKWKMRKGKKWEKMLEMLVGIPRIHKRAPLHLQKEIEGSHKQLVNYGHWPWRETEWKYIIKLLTKERHQRQPRPHTHTWGPFSSPHHLLPHCWCRCPGTSYRQLKVKIEPKEIEARINCTADAVEDASVFMCLVKWKKRTCSSSSLAKSLRKLMYSLEDVVFTLFQQHYYWTQQFNGQSEWV